MKNVTWEHRAQFFAISAQMMRRILVDAARARGADKRGGGVVKVDMEESAVLSPEPDAAIVALDDALNAPANIAPRQAKVVELRLERSANCQRYGHLRADRDAGLGVRQVLALAGIEQVMLQMD